MKKIVYLFVIGISFCQMRAGENIQIEKKSVWDLYNEKKEEAVQNLIALRNEGLEKRNKEIKMNKSQKGNKKGRVSVMKMQWN